MTDDDQSSPLTKAELLSGLLERVSPDQAFRLGIDHKRSSRKDLIKIADDLGFHDAIIARKDLLRALKYRRIQVPEGLDDVALVQFAVTKLGSDWTKIPELGAAPFWK